MTEPMVGWEEITSSSDATDGNVSAENAESGGAWSAARRGVPSLGHRTVPAGKLCEQRGHCMVFSACKNGSHSDTCEQIKATKNRLTSRPFATLVGQPMKRRPMELRTDLRALRPMLALMLV